ncbi:transposase [Acidobacteriota bacterium]
MNFTAEKERFATDQQKAAILACDVHKDEIILFTKFGKRNICRDFANRTEPIERGLKELIGCAHLAGIEDILLVAEPTGPYHNTLMRTARSLGLMTAFAGAEHVAKMRVIESNDTGKTDKKDPRVIHTLARVGKILQHRILPEPYCLLREWNKVYDAADRRVVEAKCAIHNQVKALFPDYDFKKDFIFSPSGRALMQRYGCNPYRIVRAGWKRFCAGMKKQAPRIQWRSLKRLYESAQSSMKYGIPERQAAVIELRLLQLLEDLEIHEKRKDKAEKVMIELYEAARKDDPKLPLGVPGAISTFHLARVVAETGPWSDFGTVRQFQRFAGQNLRERKSGKYKGKTKISKKGRTLFRKVANLIVLPLVKKHALFGAYYHNKTETMKGAKAMMAVARKVLKMIFGWYRSDQAFDRKRVFACESQYRKAA